MFNKVIACVSVVFNLQIPRYGELIYDASSQLLKKSKFLRSVTTVIKVLATYRTLLPLGRTWAAAVAISVRACKAVPSVKKGPSVLVRELML